MNKNTCINCCSPSDGSILGNVTEFFFNFSVYEYSTKFIASSALLSVGAIVKVKSLIESAWALSTLFVVFEPIGKTTKWTIHRQKTSACKLGYYYYSSYIYNGVVLPHCLPTFDKSDITCPSPGSRLCCMELLHLVIVHLISKVKQFRYKLLSLL